MKISIIINIIVGILVLWLIVTVWAQCAGGTKVAIIGDKEASKRALIVYNPDPFYNLDEQVCTSFAKGLAVHGFTSKVATVQPVKNDTDDYDLYVFCANTYNWAPDWMIQRFIKKHPNLEAKNAVAITLGGGSTKRAKRLLDNTLCDKNVVLLDSRVYWLMRPNDENRPEEKNAKVANDLARQFGDEIGRQIEPKWLIETDCNLTQR